MIDPMQEDLPPRADQEADPPATPPLPEPTEERQPVGHDWSTVVFDPAEDAAAIEAASEEPPLPPTPPEEVADRSTLPTFWDSIETPTETTGPLEPPRSSPPGEEPVSPQPRPEGPPAIVESKGRILSVMLLTGLLGALLGGGAVYVAADRPAASITRGTGAVQVVDPPVDPSAIEEDSSLVARVAAVVLPSVVRIDVGGGFGSSGLGSGVIYRSDGYIVTNNHVIENANSIQVTLPDGRRMDAEVVGTAAPRVDIALLKVEAEGLRPAVFGTTEGLQVGEVAVAVGTPFGLDATVTAGVISALHRTTPGQTGFPDAIQTDAPINPGNSGGALADARGTVIGINTAIASQSGASAGIGFAIPVEIVRKVADELIATGKVEFAYLGISGDNLPGRAGARVREVTPGGPAQEAGLRAGDIIIRVDDVEIRSMEELIGLLAERSVGEQVTVTFLRDAGGDQRESVVEVTLGTFPSG
ncbi:MAG: S1C family serine protease [Actinomycetota bacterium]